MFSVALGQPLDSQQHTPSCANQVLRLDLGGSHLALLSTLLDLANEGLLLLLELHADLVEFSDSLVEHSLVLAQTLGGRHALAEGPF